MQILQRDSGTLRPEVGYSRGDTHTHHPGSGRRPECRDETIKTLRPHGLRSAEGAEMRVSVCTHQAQSHRQAKLPLLPSDRRPFSLISPLLHTSSQCLHLPNTPSLHGGHVKEHINLHFIKIKELSLEPSPPVLYTVQWPQSLGLCGHCTAGQRQNTVSVPIVMGERTPSREAHAVRDRELRVRCTRHWENKIVTQPLEKLLAVSQKSEKNARSKCTLGNSTVSRACGYWCWQRCGSP